MKKLLFCLGVGMLMTACLDSESDLSGDEGAIEEQLVCDDCDGPPTGADPILLQGPAQEIRPFERRCSDLVFARQAIGLLGNIQPRGPLAKPVKVQVFQQTTQLLSFPVWSGGFTVSLNTTTFPRNFPGQFRFCIKNPGANTVSVDAQGTIISN